MKGVVFFIIFSTNIGCFFMCSAQETIRQKSNAALGSVGSLGLYFTANVYYERLITQHRLVKTFARVGYGIYASWNDEGNYLIGQVGVLLGKKNNFFEFGIGGTHIREDLAGLFPISGTLGYRFQNPNSLINFRAGVSFPEAIYIGFGITL